MRDKELNANLYYFEVTELDRMTLEQLQSLWESVPTEEQSYLVRVFERELNKRGVVEDLDEVRTAQYFLTQYQEIGFVPAGEVWVKVPPGVRDHFKLPLSTALDEQEQSEVETSNPVKSNSRLFPRWIVLLVIPFMCLLIFAVVRVATGANPPSRRTTAMVITPSPSPTVTATPTLTPTAIPPTATPFGLSGFDAAIISGERPDRDYYPVQLQVFTDRETPPRIFIVQQEEVGVAEWTYDPNPDIVSWLGGMVVRPVLGVPFSVSNHEMFLSLADDSVFVVSMNTGDVLQFVFDNRLEIRRSETNFFEQNAPGLVLVLMGQTFADGSPTDLRYLVQASYPEDQELGRIVEQARPLVAMGQVQQVGGVNVSVQETQVLSSTTLPPEWVYVVMDVQMTAPSTTMLETWTWLVAVDQSSERFRPDASAATLGNCAPMPPQLEANTAQCASIGFVISRYSQEVSLFVGETLGELRGFRLPLEPLPVVLSTADLEVQLQRISYTDRVLRVSIRIFNPTQTAIGFSNADFSLVLGFVPNPMGSSMSPNVSPQQLNPSESLDLTLEFPYQGEGFATLTLLGRIWGIEVR
jgi:hypothetical protein